MLQVTSQSKDKSHTTNILDDLCTPKKARYANSHGKHQLISRIKDHGENLLK